ncbi:MAG: HdaA/DnaA family protein [Rubrivivax sp.]|jgi:DnaA family protein
MRQVPLPLFPQPQASFESFVAGVNGLLLSQLRAAVPPRSPLYLWGPGGSGKTHLLQALGLACTQSGARVASFHNDVPGPWGFDEGLGLVILDDVHLLEPQAQRAAFALLVEAQSHGVPWAAAGPVPPVDLPLRDDLRSRLGWGQVHAVQPLPEAETRLALRTEAGRRGIFLSNEVIDYLLSRFARDLGHLMQLLDRLDVYALSHARAVTVPLLRQMLAESPIPPGQELQAGLELDA